MGQRVSKEDVKTPHFHFKEVGVRNEFNKELIVVYKPLLREDEYAEWENGYRQASTMNK